MGIKAVELLLEGQTDMMVGLRAMGVVAVPLEEVTDHSRTTVVEYYEMAKMLAR